MLVSFAAIRGSRSSNPILGIRFKSEGRWNTWGPRTWVPRSLASIGYPPFANLTNAEVSQKRPTWSKNNKDPDSVVGAELRGVDLRFASARGAFFARADLSGADLGDADLSSADLSGADLSDADLSSAELYRADLNGADLSRARLSGANLDRADLSWAVLEDADLGSADMYECDLTGTDFRGAFGLDPKQLENARNWDKAFYDDKMLKALGLPADHNDKLAEQRRKELQQKQNAAQPAPSPSPPKP